MTRAKKCPAEWLAQQGKGTSALANSKGTVSQAPAEFKLTDGQLQQMAADLEVELEDLEFCLKALVASAFQRGTANIGPDDLEEALTPFGGLVTEARVLVELVDRGILAEAEAGSWWVLVGPTFDEAGRPEGWVGQ